MPPLLVLLIGVGSVAVSVGLFHAAERLYYSRWQKLEGVSAILGIFCAACGVLLMVVGSGAAWDKHVCEVRGDQLGVDSKWTWTTYCTVKQGDRWLDIDKYRFEIGD